MKLIELIRKARENRHRFVAIDENGNAYSYPNKPKPAYGEHFFYDTSGYYSRIGYYKLTCNWKDSIIDINQLQGVK